MLRPPRKVVVTILVLVASILPLTYTGFPAIADTPKQFGYVDVPTVERRPALSVVRNLEQANR